MLLLANLMFFVLANWFAPATSGQIREEFNAEKIRLLVQTDLPQPSPNSADPPSN